MRASRPILLRTIFALLVLGVIALPLVYWWLQAEGGSIYEAIQADDVQQVTAMLDADPGLVNFRDPMKMTPLHGTAVWGRSDLAVLLLSRNADINAQNDRGRTPLHWAAACGHAPVVEVLLAHGADVRAQDQFGRTPLHATVLLAPNFEPSVEVAKQLLAAGVELDARDQTGWTALHWAASMRHPRVAAFLLSQGAEFDIYAAAALGNVEQIAAILEKEPSLIHVANFNGLTPLHWAAARGQTEVVRLLLSKGTDADPQNNRDGWTPLQKAAANGYPEVVELLLAKGADANTLNRDGQSLLQDARANGHVKIAQLLLGHGACP